MIDWVITIPKTVDWYEYIREVGLAAQAEAVLNYRVAHFPKEMKVGDRCFVVWNGRIRGWMAISGLAMCFADWTCETTDKRWPAGKYIQRIGRFYIVDDGPEMTGFRGVRRLYPMQFIERRVAKDGTVVSEKLRQVSTLPCGCIMHCVCDML